MVGWGDPLLRCGVPWSVTPLLCYVLGTDRAATEPCYSPYGSIWHNAMNTKSLVGDGGQPAMVNTRSTQHSIARPKPSNRAWAVV
jgi:hypothetical protein